MRGTTILISSDFNLEFEGEEMVTCLTTLSISSSKQIQLHQLRSNGEDNADNEYSDIGFEMIVFKLYLKITVIDFT